MQVTNSKEEIITALLHSRVQRRLKTHQ